MSEADQVDEQELKTLAEIVELIARGDGPGFRQYVLGHQIEPGWLISVLARVAGQAISEVRGFGCGPDCPEPPGHEHLVTLEDVGGGVPSISDQLIVRAINQDPETFTSLLNLVLSGPDETVGRVISDIATHINTAAAATRRQADKATFQKILDSGQGWGRL